MGLGLSGVVPTLHFIISEGLIKATTMGQMGWLLLMATLYITGACLYAARIPERFFPGKCDIWVSETHTHTSSATPSSSSSAHFFPMTGHTCLISHSSPFCLTSSSTPTSCFTSWWSQVRLFTSTASPTCRSFATQQERAALRTAPSNNAHVPHPARQFFQLFFFFFSSLNRGATGSFDRHWHTPHEAAVVCLVRVISGTSSERG